MYEYNAIVDRVVDGDTIKCTIDLGFSTWKKVTDRLVEILNYNDNRCILRVSGLGKFGRALSTVLVDTLSPVTPETGITLIDVNKQLVTEGHAVRYYGGKR